MLPSVCIWEASSPPSFGLYDQCYKLMIVLSIVFLAFLLYKAREMKQRDNYVTTESHSWEK